MKASPIAAKDAAAVVVREHYLHRRPPISFAYGHYADDGTLAAVVTFGTPPSRHALVSACPSDPSLVIELNRLWASDDLPGFESSFVASALKQLPPRIVISYADTEHGHVGYVYRALNFNYAGWTDMERRTPRFDYVVPGKHSREAFRSGDGLAATRVRRKPKARYWTTTGDKRERRNLARLCAWPRLDWRELPVPSEHRYCPILKRSR